MPLPKRGKFNARPHAGKKSKFEALVAGYLPAEVERTYEQDSLGYTVFKKYTPDWRLPDNSYVEAGILTPAKRSKLLAVMKQTGAVIRILFIRGTEKSKMYGATKKKDGTYTTNADWCDKHGIDWAVGPYLPGEWLGEE